MPLCGFPPPALPPPEKALPLSQAFTPFSADWLGPWAADYLGVVRDGPVSVWVSRLGDPGERLSFLFLDGLMGVGLTLPPGSFHIDLDPKCLLLLTPRGPCISPLLGWTLRSHPQLVLSSWGGEDGAEKTIFRHTLQYSCLENPMGRGAW